MVQYLVWRVMANRHTNITLSFLLVGHTKFWWFGLFQATVKVGSLQNVAEVLNTLVECNVAQLVSREDGTTIVPTLDWTDFFATKLNKIQKLHHFRVTSWTCAIQLSKTLTCSNSHGHQTNIQSRI